MHRRPPQPLGALVSVRLPDPHQECVHRPQATQHCSGCLKADLRWSIAASRLPAQGRALSRPGRAACLEDALEGDRRTFGDATHGGFGTLESAEHHLVLAHEHRAQIANDVARCRGLLHAARGDIDGALTALEGAIAQHDRCTMPFERARTLLVLGRVQRRRGARGRARVTLDEALIAFQQFGAPLWSEQARREIERLGRRAASPDALTPAEIRVAELAASGLANTEIAKRSFLSTKAVEANLTRVYRKHGIRSRGGLARALQAPESGQSRPLP